MSITKAHPLVISGYSSQTLAKNIAESLNSRVVDVSGRQFDDKEIQTTVKRNVRGRDVVVIASAAGDPNKQEKEARLLMRAAKRSGAKSTTLVLPYMWYGRSDDNWDERNCPALTDTIETLREHCNNVMVADPHNHGITREKFLDSSSPVQNCQTVHFAYPFAVQLKDLFNQNILCPEKLLLSHADAGSTKRISPSFRKSLYNTLELDGRNSAQDDWAQGLKDRDKATGKSKVKGFSADVKGMDVVIFEDMVSSGGTACELAEFLKESGARSVILFATSGLYTTKPDESITASVDRINNSQIDAVFNTDTYDHRDVDPDIHQAILNSPKIHTIETAPYLAAVINALHTDVTDDMDNDENSISAILSGDRSVQVMDGKPLATPAIIKFASPLQKLKCVASP